MARRRMNNVMKVSSKDSLINLKNEELVSSLNSEINSLNEQLNNKEMQLQNCLQKLQYKDTQYQKLFHKNSEYEQLLRKLILNIDEVVGYINTINLNNLQLTNQKNNYMLINARLEKKYEEIQEHLSYKIGKYILDNTKHPFNIKKHSRELLTIYKNFLVSKTKKSEDTLLNQNIEYTKFLKDNDRSFVYYKNSILALRKSNCSVILDNLHEVFELYCNVLLAVPNSEIEMEVEVEVISGSAIISYVNDEKQTRKLLEKNKKIKISMKIKNLNIYQIFQVIRFSVDSKLLVSFKKLKGVPGLLVLNHNLSKESNVNGCNLNDIHEQGISYDLPPNYTKNILWNANEIASKYNYDAAFDYIEKYVNEYQKNAINILKANANFENEETWLKDLNTYLKGFDLAGIELNKNTNMLRFHRIECNKKLKKIKNDKKVTIIMPAYNAENTIIKAINSILNQTWDNLELIVVDDFSSDSTWELIESITDTRVIKLRNKMNLGAYVSKNLALKYATGDYITGHDSDDWAHPQRLEKHMHQVLLTNGRVKASITKMLRLDVNGRFNFFAKEGPFCEDGVTRIASITCLFEANFLKQQLGGWDTARFGADSEIIARAKIILNDDEFQNYNQLAMICLDAEGSLTNDIIHGVSKIHGISPTRKEYKNNWQEWHKTITKENAYLPFPHEIRFFNIPEANSVNIVEFHKLYD